MKHFKQSVLLLTLALAAGSAFGAGPFSFSYGGFNSDDWQNKQRGLDQERARVSARARSNGADSTGAAQH